MLYKYEHILHYNRITLHGRFLRQSNFTQDLFCNLKHGKTIKSKIETFEPEMQRDKNTKN